MEDQKNYPVAIAQKTYGLIPTDFEQAYRMAKIMAASGLMPKGISTPEAVFVAVQMGAEIGLSPMASVQNIAVINGRPGIYGDAALAIVRASGLLEVFEEWSDGKRKTPEWTFYCKVKRKGYKETIGSFSWAQACEAGLNNADGHSPWKKWTDRMMQFKARNFPLRDQFADWLKGIRTIEEQHDAIEADFYNTEADEQAGLRVDDVMTIDERFTTAFSGMIETSGVSFSELDKFVETLAAKKKTTVEAVKESALKEQERFIGAFTKHLAKLAKEAAEKPVEAEKPKAPILCPSTKKGVFPEECAGCAASEKCDQYAEFIFEQGQVAE